VFTVGKGIQANLASSDPAMRSLLQTVVPYIQNLARCDQVAIQSSIGEGNHSARSVVAGIQIELPLAGMIDLEVERTRLKREISKIEKELLPVQQKLANEDFIRNAPEKVVMLNRSRVIEFEEKLNRLQDNLRRLS